MEINETEYILARRVLRLANLITINRNTDIKELGLTTGQADSLLYFSKNEGKSASDLKDHLGITHQTARGIIARMVDKGLLETNTSKEDARYKKIVLTDKGWELYECLKKNGMYTGRRLLNGMTEREKEQFFSMITLAVNNMEASD